MRMTEPVRWWSSSQQNVEATSSSPSSSTAGSSDRSHFKPNILLITTDQQRRDTLGCYSGGGDFVSASSSSFTVDDNIFKNKFSPNIDKLAREGVRFTQVPNQNSLSLFSVLPHTIHSYQYDTHSVSKFGYIHIYMYIYNLPFLSYFFLINSSSFFF
jgi:hypothetical protein